MNLLEQIKNVALEARKLRQTEKATSLITLIAEAEIIGKNDGNRQTTDQEVIQVIKKTIKNIQLTIENVEESVAEKFHKEKALLESFLPTQMTEDEIEAKFKSLCEELKVESVKMMGVVMKEFKARFGGLYDNSTLAKISKKVLG